MTEKATAELVREAQGNARAAAFTELVRRFQDMAVGFALGRVGEPDEALDVAQEAFTDAFVHLGQLREPAAFAGWFRRILHKHCDRRTRRRIPGPSAASAVAPPQPDELVEASRDFVWLRDAIESLPEHQRVVVALHYLGDTAQKDVAEFLELPLTTVKKRLFVARESMKERRESMDHQVQELRPSLDQVFADRIGLFLAIRAGDHAAVQTILSRSPELIEAEETWANDEALENGLPFSHRLTPLILAASRRDAEMVERLLRYGASPHGRCGCSNGESALWAAIRAGSHACAQHLLGADADANVRNPQGHTPLHVAALRGRVDLVELLLEHGACEYAAESGMTPTDWARRHAHDDVVRALGGEPSPLILTPERAGHPHIVSGIKAIDLFSPLRRGDVVRVHGAAETGLMVLVSELSRRFIDAGGSAVWVGWEARPWQLGELDTVAAEAGIEDVVRVVKAVHDDASSAASIVDRAIARSEEARAAGDATVAVFVFEEEGHAADLEAALPRLSRHADLLFIVRPWVAVTRGDLDAPSLFAPYDVVICTDPELARAGIYPAIHPLHSRVRKKRSSERHLKVQSAVRALLGGVADDERHRRAERVQAFLSQPFFVAEHQTGWKAESVPMEETLGSLERILSGELDTVPVDHLRYLGPLPLDEEDLQPRVPRWA